MKPDLGGIFMESAFSSVAFNFAWAVEDLDPVLPVYPALSGFYQQFCNIRETRLIIRELQINSQDF